MDKKIKQINDYLHSHQNYIVISLLLGMVFLLFQEIPFVNILIPPTAPVWVFFISLIIFFKLFKMPKFLLGMVFLTVVYYFFQLTSLSEGLANLIFVILFILVISKIFSFYKSIK